jgi:hypothetical protein
MNVCSGNVINLSMSPHVSAPKKWVDFDGRANLIPRIYITHYTRFAVFIAVKNHILFSWSWHHAVSQADTKVSEKFIAYISGVSLRQRQYIHPRRCYPPTRLHGLISQQTTVWKYIKCCRRNMMFVCICPIQPSALHETQTEFTHLLQDRPP